MLFVLKVFGHKQKFWRMFILTSLGGLNEKLRVTKVISSHPAEHKCVFQILLQFIHFLLRYFSQKHKHELHGGARGNVRSSAKS